MNVNRRWINLVGLAMATAVPLTIVGSCARAKDKEPGEIAVTLAQTPTAVQATLTQQIGNGKLESIDKEVKDGKTTYEADATINGKEYEINVAEDGTLLGKTLEHEKDEVKGEKSEKSEAGEKPDND